MTGCILNIENAVKDFASLRAVDDVSLSLNNGETVALLGHNGAGKTTLMRLILGFIRPDSGLISIEGAQPGSDQARRKISYLPENVTFPKTLTGEEILCFYASLKGATQREARTMLERVGLSKAGKRRVGEYSKGMRQRLGLAQALLGAPHLMLLDEPTSGLDPVSRADFYTLISQVTSEGCGVILSSHSLEEIESKTDRIAILRSGRLIADAPLQQLQAEAALPIHINIRAIPEMADQINAQLGGARMNGQSIEISCPVTEKMEKLQAILALGADITDIELRPPNLNEIYQHLSRSGEEPKP